MSLSEDLKDYLEFAVAGNFANHLGEVGGAGEFSVIQTTGKDAPKGLFPFHIKNHNSFLGTYPICNEIILTHGREEDNLQIEAEVALICDFVYENEKIIDIIPRYFAAFNDCSLRAQDGNKLSYKKNWGEKAKGTSQDVIEIDNFTEKEILSKYHISFFIKRDGIVYDYGTISTVKSYSYFFEKLKDWMVQKINTQEDCGSLEGLGQFLKDAHGAKGILVVAGAAAYADFGKKNFLKKGDEIFIYVYNVRAHSFNDIMNDMCGVDTYLRQCSKLHQIVQ